MRQHHQGVQTMWLKPNSTRSMSLRCAQCQGPHVIHRTAPQASGCIHTRSNFPAQVIWKTMAFDLAPMIESLHRAPCAAHMLLSMVAQSIVTVGHFFPRTARRTVPRIRSGCWKAIGFGECWPQPLSQNFLSFGFNRDSRK